MLVNIKEVSVLCNRAVNSVKYYVNIGLLPEPQKIMSAKSRKVQHWNLGAVLLCLPGVNEFQIRTSGDKRVGSKKRRAKYDSSYRPPLTIPQQAANNAFNMCIHA